VPRRYSTVAGAARSPALLALGRGAY
jgi:hypothetical protein